MWTSIGIALLTNICWQVPLFIVKFTVVLQIYKLQKYTNDQWSVLQEFWQLYESQSYEECCDDPGLFEM